MNTLHWYMIRAIALVAIIPLHEFAHGYVAGRLGDDTARLQGRLTLNPAAHLDLVGTIALIFLGFGWAKPVPINSRNFQNPRRDMALSALAGPVANILLAWIFMILAKLIAVVWRVALIQTAFPALLYGILYNIAWISLCLAVFNLLPIPPLDGFKIFGSILPDKFYFFVLEHEQYIFLVMLLLLGLGILSLPISAGANALYWLLDTVLTAPLNLFL